MSASRDTAFPIGTRCEQCGYAVAGLPIGSICPECGQDIVRSAALAEHRADTQDAVVAFLLACASVVTSIVPLANLVVPLLATVMAVPTIRALGRSHRPAGVSLCLAWAALLIAGGIASLVLIGTITWLW